MNSPLSESCPARFVCKCGHRLEVLDVAEIDFLRYDPTSNFFTADCPACQTTRPTKTLDMGSVVCIAAGEFITPPADEKPLYRDIQNSTFEGVPNPIDFVQEPFSPRCGTCEAILSEDDKRADSSAPETGWEYYECPDCGETTHPANAELDDAAQPNV